MKEYLLEPLLPNATLFAHITRLDSRGDAHHEYAGLFKEVSEQEIRDAAAFVGAAASNVEVLEGPNVEVPTCQSNQSGANDVTVTRLGSLAGQLSHRNGCLQLISRHENRTGEMFSAILLVRADLTIYVPFAPSCLFDFSNVHSLVDWYHSMPRARAREMITDPYEHFYTCKRLVRLQKDVDDYLNFFFAKAHMSGASLPIMITRENAPRFPNNMCNMFKNSLGVDRDPDSMDLCGKMTYANPYNRDATENEAAPPPVAQMLCAQRPKPRVALCLHGSLEPELPEVVSALRTKNLLRQLGAEDARTFLHLLLPSSGALRSEAEALRVRLNVAAEDAQFPEIMGTACSAGGEGPGDVSEVQWHQEACLKMIQGEGGGQGHFDLVVMLRSGVVPMMGTKPYCMYGPTPRRYLNLAYIGQPAAFRRALEKWKVNCSISPANSTMHLMGDVFQQDESLAMGIYSPSDPCKLFETTPKSLLHADRVKKALRGIPLSPGNPNALCQKLAAQPTPR